MGDDYNRYLRSSHWRTRRSQYLATSDPTCERCGTDGTLHVHHRRYSNLGNEQDADLTALCDRCHALVHTVHRKLRTVKANPGLVWVTRGVLDVWDDDTVQRLAQRDPQKQRKWILEQTAPLRQRRNSARKTRRQVLATVRTAKFQTSCEHCTDPILPGDPIHYDPKKKLSHHQHCNPAAKAPARR